MLLDVGFIPEVYHLDWLANPVLVPKKNKEWRICVYYIDVNCLELSCWLHSRMQPTKLLGLLLVTHSDPPQGWRWNQDIFHYSVRHILLYHNALRTQKWVHISYAALQVHKIVNVAVHREYPPVSYLFNPNGSSNSIMSKMYTRITLVGTINPNRGYIKWISWTHTQGYPWLQR
jgi:hypothetical protein